MKYTCPICDFKLLEFPPEDHEICPICRTHFDYSDSSPTSEGKLARQAMLRERWNKLLTESVINGTFESI